MSGNEFQVVLPHSYDSLCGVDDNDSIFPPQPDCLTQTSATKGVAKPWKSTGKGKKRKKKKSANRRASYKKHRADVHMHSATDTLANSELKNTNDEPFDFAGASMIVNNHVHTNYNYTTGHGNQKTDTKNACITAKQAPVVKTKRNVCCSHVRGFRGGGVGAGGGDDGDDEGGGRDPRKLSDHGPCSYCRQQQKASSGSKMDVGSPLAESKDQEVSGLNFCAHAKHGLNVKYDDMSLK